MLSETFWTPNIASSQLDEYSEAGITWGAGIVQLLERSRVRVPAGAAEGFFSPGSIFCADSYFGIRSTPVLPQ